MISLFDHFKKQYIPITYWENSIGRNRHCDIVVNSPTASRDHAVLYRRQDGWFVEDTNSKTGVYVNNKLIDKEKKVCINDVIQIGGMNFTLCKNSQNHDESTAKYKIHSNLFIMLMVLIFETLAVFELLYYKGDFDFKILAVFLVSQSMFWIHYFINRFGFGRTNYELETIAYFLSSIGILNICCVNIKMAYTQIIALFVGFMVFNFLIFFMKNPDFAMKCRPYIAILAVLFLVFNLVFGKIKNGSQNWIMLGPVSIQPSEFVKIAFVFFGASTLIGLQTTKNLTEFILFSCACMGSLFLMGDFGTACIFFVAFIIISFMRSGSIRTVFLTISAALIGISFIFKFKPYIVTRFSAWRHIWQHASDIGYQQCRVLSYIASGSLFGMGLEKGCLKYVFAAVSDLSFGMTCEQWGMIIGFISIISIAFIAIYAKLLSQRSRSAFYSIGACGAAGIMIFQMMMHVFGSTDILPLTGVTLPFMSLGGSSLISVWGLLAFIKAADERTYGLKKYK